MNDVSNLLEVNLKKPENFLKVKETLTRIGVASRKDNTLYQSCHILHKKGKYYIVHFKEMFYLDNKNTDFSEEDMGRRNAIANLLEEWDLIEIVDKEMTEYPLVPANQIKIISFKEKENWNLKPKYNIGKKV